MKLVDDFVLVGGYLGSDELRYNLVDEKTGAIYAIPREEITAWDLKLYGG